jgi:cell shape-determining protein MreD
MSKLALLKENERKLFFVAFLAGFVWDWLTIKLMSLNEVSLVLGLYLFVIASSIVIHNKILSQTTIGFFGDKIARMLPYLIQFMFGTLFNAAFIFYSESAELHSSWPFILFLIVVVFSNEIFRKHHNAMFFQLIMFFVASLLYFVFVVPIFLTEISTRAFLISGGLGLAFLFTIMFLLSRLARKRFLHKHILLVTTILLLYGLFNFLYFSNIIPPIPLALKNSGIYHSLKRTGNNYEVKYEPSNNLWSDESKIFHISPDNQTLYVFTSIFAPANISVPIYHEWWHFDEEIKKWMLSNKVEFPIIGGREDGYRGYSVKENIESGKWMVYISTENNKRLGHISFEVEKTSQRPKLSSKII